MTASFATSPHVSPRALRLAMLLGLAGLGGCAVGPDYTRPKVEAPAAFKEAAGWKPATPADSQAKGAWWEVFNDPVLNDLESQVATSNQSLLSLAAAYEEARQLARSDQATFLPSLSADGSGSRSKSAASKGGTGSLSTSYSASLQASWEPDFWGRIRRLTEADASAAQVSAATLANARLSLQASLAQDYIEVRILDEKKRLIEKAVEDYRRTLSISKNKYAVGVAARSDVLSAEAQLDAARAQAVDVGVLRAQVEHALAVLLGRAPADFSLAAKPAFDLVAPDVPVTVPAALLERRPDIAQAERAVAEANARVGLQTAAYFPTISLSASGGYTGSPLSQLFHSPFRFWSVGGSAAESLFDAGQRHDQVLAAKAAYQASVATYRQSVLAAFQQVEDQLSDLRILSEEAGIQSSAVAEAADAARIAQNEYAAGTVDYTTVVSAEVTELNDRESSLAILQGRLNASVVLIQGLGGGWTQADLPTPSQVVARHSVP